MQETLNVCNPKLYPQANIRCMLTIITITPVTSATVERGNSRLKYIKNDYRSTCLNDRRNALLLVFIHKDIQVDYDAVIDMYARRNPRKMIFINPLG